MFADYFRCPDGMAELVTSEHLSAHEGYFTFGEAVCYGKCDGPEPRRHVAGLLPEVSDRVARTGNGLTLPFDLSNVVTNLRQERYRRRSNRYLERITSASASRDIYYFFRPILPVAVRKHLQRLSFTGWNRIPFPRWPVDVTVDTLMRSVMALELKSGRVNQIPFVWFWPDGKPSCTMLTHDVEAEAGLDFCGTLMDLDDASGFKSAFQLIPEGRYETSKDLFETFRRRGFEANVHDLNHDGRLFHSRQQFAERAARINEYGRAFHSRGFRAGAMYRNQEWYDLLECSFDMSVPDVAHLEPQRGGCCTVLPYFIGRLLELPLTTIQDYSLFHILGDYSTAIWKTQIDLILASNGLISVLTHPDYLIETRARAVYVEILAHLAELRDQGRTWMALPSEVDRWWRSRDEMTLVPSGGSWRIEGAGSDRARVAYAMLENDRLVYRVDQ